MAWRDMLEKFKKFCVFEDVKITSSDGKWQ
jgi:hypothetical protein